MPARLPVLAAPAAAAAAAWAYLLAGHGRYWRADVRLPAADQAPPAGGWPPVRVVVPARDEAPLVGRTIAALVGQDYPGEIEVVLVDDASTDGTATAAARAAGVAGDGGGHRLTVVTGAERPEGWAGKLWAVHQGVTHGPGGRSPEWLLLTDADIAHPPDSLRHLVAFALADGRDLVSLMARLRTVTAAERLVVPAFVYFFGQLYPFRRVAGQGRTAAAAGGCILVRRDVLERAGGVAAVRGAIIDDVALARAVRRAGGRLWLGLADDVRSLRPYPRLADLWDMVARSAFTQLRYSAVPLVGTAAGLALLYVVPVASVAAGLARRRPELVLLGGAGWAAMTASYLPTVRYHGLRRTWALTLPATAVLYGAMTVDSARRHWTGRGVAWKGRSYAASR